VDGGNLADAPGATTLALLPTSDAYVDQGAPATNFGTAVAMKTDGNGPGIKAKRSFVAFDMSPLPSGSAVATATLQLCITALGGMPPNAPGHTHVVERITASWVESVITWTDQPAVDASIVASIVIPGGLQCVSFDVATEVQAWVSGTRYFGWRIRDNDESSGPSSLDYGTREHGIAAEQPSLSVSYTPGT
jgi:hypothetical protein